MQWIKASERTPDKMLWEKLHYKLDGRRVDGNLRGNYDGSQVRWFVFLSGQEGYVSMEDLSRVEWLDETESAPSSDQLREALEETRTSLSELIRTVSRIMNTKPNELADFDKKRLQKAMNCLAKYFDNNAPKLSPSEALALPASPGSGWVHLFEDFPNNKPLYLDSGLWQLRSDDMEEVLIQQGYSEPFNLFIDRCREVYFNTINRPPKE